MERLAVESIAINIQDVVTERYKTIKHIRRRCHVIRRESRPG